MSFRARLSGGNFVAGGALDDVVEATMGESLYRGGLVIEGTVKEATPVIEGHLRRDWKTGRPQRTSGVYRVSVGNRVIYARRVQFVGKSAGYATQGFEAGKSAAVEVIREGLRDLARGVWRR